MEVLDKDNERWQVIWEIWVRMEIFLQTFVTDEETGTPAKIFADQDEMQLSG